MRPAVITSTEFRLSESGTAAAVHPRHGCRGVNRHAVASKKAGPAPISISLGIFCILLPIFTCHFTGHVADRASRRYEYARFGAGPVTTCGPAHFASDD